jgi:hypothetical protein
MAEAKVETKAAPYVGQVYESFSPHRGLYGTNFRVKFMPNASTARPNHPTGFGEISSTNETLITHANIKNKAGDLATKPEAAKALEALIENDADFQKNKRAFEAGTFGAGGKYTGIWLKKWRIEAEGRATVTDFRKSLAQLGPDGLRKLIVDNNGTPPADKDASIDELVTAAFIALGNNKAETA